MPNVSADRALELVCVPGAIPAQERAAHFDLGRRLFTELAEERVDQLAGIALRLPADAFEQVAWFVGNERKCCPFLRVEIDIAPSAGSMWLRLTGPQGTRELLEAELGLNISASCGCN